tara:strand:- start:17965 stop:18912 length:948 start_codon:yes stop_codon:yes gene_type:complete
MDEPLSRAVAEQAASWYVDLLDEPADPSRRDAHQRWLAQSDEHRRAWARLEKLQGRLEQAPAGVARATLNQARTSRRRMIKGLAVLLVAGGAGLGWQRSDQYQALTARYRTGTGEQRSLYLADGGELVLNTDSSVDVDYGAGARRVILHHGEILVTTAPDPQGRPFTVDTRHGSVLALGTRFSVYSDDVRAQVGVMEKAVEIRPTDNGQPPLRLEAGQQADFSHRRVGQARPLNADALAWRNGLLVASDWRLEAFLTELSRYRPGRLVCDQQVADLRLSGAFNLTDTDVVLENLTQTLPVRLTYFTRYWVRVGAK